MIDAAEAVASHFHSVLMPRNHGLITVVPLSPPARWGDPRQKADGFLVALGEHPFLEVNFEDGAITLHVMYPRAIAFWDPARHDWSLSCGGIAPLPKRPKQRGEVLQSLSTKRVDGGRSISFGLCEPDSLTKAEFYMHSIITKVKYMVTKKFGYGRPKDDIDLVDLIDFAAAEYDRKVLKAVRRKG